MPHDITKLPRWAQDKIMRQAETIREQADELTRYRQAYSEVPEGRDDDGFRFVVHRHTTEALRIPLGLYRCGIQTPLGFRLDFDPRREGVGVRLNADPGRGTDCLMVQPQSGNHAILCGGKM